MTRITISLEDSVAERVADLAKVQKRSVSAQIALAVDEQIERQPTTKQLQNQIIERITT